MLSDIACLQVRQKPTDVRFDLLVFQLRQIRHSILSFQPFQKRKVLQGCLCDIQ